VIVIRHKLDDPEWHQHPRCLPSAYLTNFQSLPTALYKQKITSEFKVVGVAGPEPAAR
jgi:hypothetical protein